MVAPALLAWPNDAVMLVSSLAGEEVREQMEGVYPATCRHCGKTVHADTFSVRRAEASPLRHGRPFMFFCVSCATKIYDRAQIEHLEVHNFKVAERTANVDALVAETVAWLRERAAWLEKAASHRGGTNLHALDLLREQVRIEAARLRGRATLIDVEADRLRVAKPETKEGFHE